MGHKSTTAGLDFSQPQRMNNKPNTDQVFHCLAFDEYSTYLPTCILRKLYLSGEIIEKKFGEIIHHTILYSQIRITCYTLAFTFFSTPHQKSLPFHTLN